MRRIEARRKNASAFRLRHSQSLAKRRQRLSHAMVRSTIQRLGNTTNPLTGSERLTISMTKMRQNFCKHFRKFRSLISAVGEQRLQKRKHAEQRRHDENASIAILNVGPRVWRGSRRGIRAWPRMSQMGHKRKSRPNCGMSAAPPESRHSPTRRREKLRGGRIRNRITDSVFGIAGHSESPANLLIHIRSYSASYSECVLISLKVLSDFDSTMRRFESSRPSQPLTQPMIVCNFVG
jgi:hypothetical protein